MTALIVNVVTPPEPGEWAVWDRHERRWVTSGRDSEREAWRDQLSVLSPHPWELSIRKNGERRKPATDCELCDAAGACPTCSQECPDCNGTGEVEEE